MFELRDDFNCCKTVSCRNFGVVKSSDYIYKSRRLGFLSLECTACGSNPPWVNNELINSLIKEKLSFHFARKISHCRNCYQYFFFNDKNTAQLHGFTPAGTQRLKCKHCHRIYSQQKHKNIDAMRAVLKSVVENIDINTALKESGLSSRLYYFYLEKLSLLLINFSRLKEQGVIETEYIALQTEGKIMCLNSKRGFYTLLTSEAESGYILLQSINLTQQELQQQDIYNSTEDSNIKDNPTDNIHNKLTFHYQQTLQRKHFERLLIGELKPIKHCHLIYPNKLVYVHFTLLRGFIRKAERYRHYIELESSIRSAVLMSAYPEIDQKKADIYYYLPFPNNRETLNNKKIGWWDDRWFSFESGAYSPITNTLQNGPTFRLKNTDYLNIYYHYLDTHLNKNLNSFNTITNFSEIHRVLFNFCHEYEGKTAATKFNLNQVTLTPNELLDAAVNLIDHTI